MRDIRTRVAPKNKVPKEDPTGVLLSNLEQRCRCPITQLTHFQQGKFKPGAVTATAPGRCVWPG